MVNSTESIGRLIAGEVLFQADRQLLRHRGQSGQQAEEKPAQQTQPAISHNDKAVSSVLRTLIDEQLDAAANALSANAALANARDGEGLPVNKIAAQYAEADVNFRPDAPDQRTPIAPDTLSQQILLAASSPELRMAMQSAFLSAAVRAQLNIGGEKGHGRQRRTNARGIAAAPILRIGAGMIAVALLIIIFAAKFA